MKKLHLLKTVLLLCALIVGSNAWAQTTVKDVLTASDFAATGTTYTDFSNVSKTSDAVYAGQSAKDGSGNIQLRSKNSNSGIVSTTSGGTVKSVKITVGSGSNTIDVYGSNTAYTAASDLYDNNSRGTKIGSLTETGTVTFPTETDYEYVGIRSNSGAVYLSSIEIEWTTGGGDNPTINATPTSLSDFTYVEGSGPSAVQTISVSGSNLTDDIYLMVDEDYEISTSQDSGYSDEVTLDKGEGTVSATNVYVRLKSGLEKGSHDGIIIISSTDATDVEVSLSGSVTGQKYAITVATGLEGGEIEADPTSAAEDAEVTLSATPESGYRLSAWDVYKTGDATTKVSVTNNKFTMPAYAVTVSATFEEIPSVTYTPTTSIVPGRHYIITSGTTGTVRAMGYQDTNNRRTVEVNVDATEGTITVAEDAGVYEFLIGVEDDDEDYKGYFTIYDASTTSPGYLYAAASSANQLKTQANNNLNGEWAITINETTGVASIVAKQSSYRNVMQYNYNNGNPLFACYASASQSSVYLFEKNGDTGTQDFTASINAACTDGKGNYYGTFSAPFAFTVPAGVTVSEIAINNEGKFDVDEYEAGDIIPANTGVMISSTTAGNKTFTSAKGGTSVKGDNNKLRPTYWGLTAQEMGDADDYCLFYRLTMHNGTDIGFWWGAAGGAAFEIAGYKAYLAVPEAQAARVFWFEDGETTSIRSIENGKMTIDNYYNLNGQRVAQPTKGLYIVNGKKVIVK